MHALLFLHISIFLGFECFVGGILCSYITVFFRIFTGEKYFALHLTLFMSFFYLSDDG